MARQDLLLEIGLEEMPAQFMPPALAQLREAARQGLAEARLEHGEIQTYGTPRRIALYVHSVAPVQRDLAVKVRGPSVKAAFDPQGNPTKALQGFARGQGVDIAAVIQEDVNGVPYVFANRVERGLPAREVLPQLLQAWIANLSFPKPMRWGWGELRFARPIRWLVALLGPEVLPLEVGGVTADRKTWGHRFLAPEPLSLSQPGEYLAKLEAAWVMADPERRRELIWRQVAELAAFHGGKVEEDGDLLEEITFLVEYPTALWGAIDQRYMDLPAEVLVTSMKEHQRYFPVLDAQGRLLPGFIAVRSGSPEHLDLVRKGNEKVLRARLDDAAFFWAEDQKLEMDTLVDRLAKVVFLEKLGTVRDRVERLVVNSAWLADHLGAEAAVKALAQRGAYLAKADLTTNMVNEFPELQGIMGEKYALLAGEEKGAAQAVREHYLPRFAGDALPESPAGTILALADKMDLIIGCFCLGMIPTGSQDPYGLRRQAQGICHMAMEKELSLSLSALAERVYRSYEEKFSLERSLDQVRADVLDFFAQRLRFLLGEAGVTYDVIEAVLAAGIDKPAQVKKRALALTDFRRQENFGALLTAYTRAANLAQKGEGGEVKAESFQDPAETRLWREVQAARQGIAAAGADYAAAFQVMADLRPAVDAFFDAVMVMAEEPELRRNRLALLSAVVALMDGIADLSRIVE
ncbi:MAG: glycine--tRNA ligase subunit beta [Bacillota bacterium]|jgi:glycyl-tRNA synthetase beta chain